MALVYRPRHNPSPKYHATNKWKPHISTKHIPHANSHTCLSMGHNTHQNHKPHNKSHPYSIRNPHATHKLYPKNKVTSAYRLHHTTNNKRHIQNNRSNHKTHPNFKHLTKFNYQLKFTSNSKYKPYPKIQRPRPTGLATQIITHTTLQTTGNLT